MTKCFPVADNGKDIDLDTGLQSLPKVKVTLTVKCEISKVVLYTLYYELFMNS